MKVEPMKKRVIIVGGVAGGASCAARLRRMDEGIDILMLDRGPHVSFANCGLPYLVGGVIGQESSLLIAGEKIFKERLNIEVRTRHEVLAVDRAKKEIVVRDLERGREHRERYDALVLAPGAAPLRPPLPGIDLPGIFTLRSIPDSREIRAWIETRKARRAVIVGGGFIGLEMAENLMHRGLEVTIVEMLRQVMPPIDPEIAAVMQEHLEKNGVRLALGDGVAGFEAAGSGGLAVKTAGGQRHEADLIVLAIGVRPETKLASEAGLELGERGGIRVDDRMRTSDPSIWAVGDAVEVRDAVTGQWTLMPLAGPANREGRIAADAIAGRPSRFRGTQATAICGAFGMAVASTGASEKALQRAGFTDFDKVYLHPGQHAGYYPGAKRMHLKLLFRKSDGLVLGAQAAGEDGVDKRIDVIAMAIQKRATVFDLEEAELCYAPQFGSAKDPVNFAGMIAANALRGDMPLAHWNRTDGGGAALVDVRDPEEFAEGHIEGAVNLPLHDLRKHLDELSGGGPVRVYCGVGQRAYYATRLLRQHGIDASNLSGGFETARLIGLPIRRDGG